MIKATLWQFGQVFISLSLVRSVAWSELVESVCLHYSTKGQTTCEARLFRAS